MTCIIYYWILGHDQNVMGQCSEAYECMSTSSLSTAGGIDIACSGDNSCREVGTITTTSTASSMWRCIFML